MISVKRGYYVRKTYLGRQWGGEWGEKRERERACVWMGK